MPDLIAAIDDFIRLNNAHPKLFVSTKKVEEILDKVNHCKAVIETLHLVLYTNPLPGSHSCVHAKEGLATRLFVLNLPYYFSQSRLQEALEGCNVTSIVLARTIYGVLASVETAGQKDAKTAETILSSLKLPAPLGLVHGDTAIGEKLGEVLLDLTEGQTAYSNVA